MCSSLDQEIIVELFTACNQLVTAYEYELRDSSKKSPEIERAHRAITLACRMGSMADFLSSSASAYWIALPQGKQGKPDKDVSPSRV